MINKVDYSRQLKLFNPENQKYNIHIFGCGHLGSSAAIILAKTGFNNITLYDMDLVGEENIASQFFKVSQIGERKTKALADVIKELTDVECNIIDGEIKPGFVPDLAMNNIFVLSFDNLESRKVIFDALKGINCYLLDSRAGGEEWNIITSKMNDEDDLKLHEFEFNITPTQLECGYKSVAYSAIACGAEICNIVKKINEEQVYPKNIRRGMRMNFILSDRK